MQQRGPCVMGELLHPQRKILYRWNMTFQKNFSAMASFSCTIHCACQLVYVYVLLLIVFVNLMSNKWNLFLLYEKRCNTDSAVAMTTDFMRT